MSIFAIALNLLLVALLLAAVVVGMRLSARLKGLKASQAEFAKAVGELDAAANRAQAALAELKLAGEEASDRLARQVSQAAALSERMERGLTKAREAAPKDTPPEARAALAKARAGAVLPGGEMSREPLLRAKETPRSLARVDDDLFDPPPAGGLKSIPGGRP